MDCQVLNSSLNKSKSAYRYSRVSPLKSQDSGYSDTEDCRTNLSLVSSSLTTAADLDAARQQ